MPAKTKRALPSRKKAAKRIPWSASDLKALRQNAAKGLPTLKRLLKRSEPAIRVKASEAGISLRRK